MKREKTILIFFLTTVILVPFASNLLLVADQDPPIENEKAQVKMTIEGFVAAMNTEDKEAFLGFFSQSYHARENPRTYEDVSRMFDEASGKAIGESKITLESVLLDAVEKDSARGRAVWLVETTPGDKNVSNIENKVDADLILKKEKGTWKITSMATRVTGNLHQRTADKVSREPSGGTNKEIEELEGKLAASGSAADKVEISERLATLYARVKDADKADAMIGQALNLCKNTEKRYWRMMFFRVSLNVSRGDTENAIDAYRHMMNNCPFEAWVAVAGWQKARLEKKAGKHEEALKTLEALVKKAPKFKKQTEEQLRSLKGSGSSE